jgi:hypothetical protein
MIALEVERLRWRSYLDRLIRRLSLGWQYFDPSGIYADLSGQLVHQELERQSAAQNSIEGSDEFLILDASIGHRFPSRRGVISVYLNNPLDKKFNYLDNSYRVAEFRTNSPYLPERSVLVRLTLNF